MSNFITVIDAYDNAITVIGAGADEKAKEMLPPIISDWNGEIKSTEDLTVFLEEESGVTSAEFLLQMEDFIKKAKEFGYKIKDCIIDFSEDSIQIGGNTQIIIANGEMEVRSAVWGYYPYRAEKVHCRKCSTPLNLKSITSFSMDTPGMMIARTLCPECHTDHALRFTLSEVALTAQ